MHTCFLGINIYLSQEKRSSHLNNILINSIYYKEILSDGWINYSTY